MKVALQRAQAALPPSPKRNGFPHLILEKVLRETEIAEALLAYAVVALLTKVERRSIHGFHKRAIIRPLPGGAFGVEFYEYRDEPEPLENGTYLR